MAECVDAYRGHRCRGRRRGSAGRPAAAGHRGTPRCRGARAAARRPGHPRPPWSVPPTRSTAAAGRLVHLPDAPFLLGRADPAAVLRPLVSGPGHRRQRRELGGAGRTRRGWPRPGLVTSPTFSSAKDSARRSSAAGRSCAGMRAWLARSPTSSSPAPVRPSSSTCSALLGCGSRGRCDRRPPRAGDDRRAGQRRCRA